VNAAREFIARQAARGRGVLVLAATRGAADDLVRSACETALRGVQRHTLRDLALTLSETVMNDRGLAPVRRIAREALAALVTGRAAPSLGYLKPVIAFPGFARALARTLEDLRLNQIPLDALRDAGRSGPDLATLLDLYQQELAERKLADHALRTALALEHAGPAPAMLIAHVRPRGRLEERLLNQLAASAPQVLRIDLPEPGTGDEATTNLASVKRYALSGLPAPLQPPDATVAIFSASGEALECVEIARRILTAAKAGTLLFDRAAVLLRSPQRYQPLVEEAFTRAGIPTWFSQGTHRPDPGGRAFLALLRCRAEGLSASRFAEYMSLGQMPGEEGEQRFPAAWERDLVDAAVVGGRDRWERRLDGLLHDLNDKYDRAAEGASERPGLARRIARLEALRGFALPKITLLDALPQSALWGDWLDALSELAGLTLREPGAVEEILDELRPLAGIGPVTLDEVIPRIQDELITRREESKGTRYGKVWVGSIEEAAGMSFDEVFVPGLNEGVFPQAVREDPLLLDSQRAPLGIEGSEDDARLLRTAAWSAKRRLTVSWSRLDLASGRERVPSFYAFEVAESARGGDLDVKAFEQQAREHSRARLGRPAPDDPADAIDDAEYDLAWVDRLGNKPAPGAALYLETAGPAAYRSLIARKARWEKNWSRYDGLLAENEVLLELDRWQPDKHAYSPTELEQFARCPYRFLLWSVYGLRPARTAEGIQRMEPGLRGDLYHDVQQRLLTALQAEGKLPVGAGHLDAALAHLDTVLQEVSAEAQERYVPAIPLVWQADLERLRGDLRAWLRHVAEHESDWTPEKFEWKFEKLMLESGILLTGRVDLIERHKSGRLRITDHKTGKAPEKKLRPEYTGGGSWLQPLLYAAAVTADTGEPVREARLFYSTIRENFAEVRIGTGGEGQDEAAKVIAHITDDLRNSRLPAAPRQDACENCDYVVVCGPYEEDRVQRKAKRPDLIELRRIP